MAWANFDQPDLKAVHGFVVSAPETWTVLSNSPSTSVDDLADGGRLWTFADTPPLSTYVVVVNAGPFYELRSRRGGYDLGLYCRQSLKGLLDRDAEELFELTEQGLAWFGEHFGIPFGQERYDHVFVPDLGGAMENWGCVTCGDWALPRSTPTYDERREIAEVVLHEMAHMWFGDLVTMRWWDDLWLNEAFASWAACWAAEGATRYSDGWATFLAAAKQDGYRLDMGPAKHPIRGDVPDVAQAMANFDAISYSKGQAVLRQLGAYAGDDAFLEGLRAYFRDHAWGNTTLQDLIAAIATASGQRPRRVGDGLARPRRHRHARAVRRPLTSSAPTASRRGRTVSTSAATPTRTPVYGTLPMSRCSPRTHTKVELPDCDLRLVNDHDLTFAAARTDQQSLDLMLAPRRRAPRRRVPGAGRDDGLRHARQGRAECRRHADLHAGCARDRTPRRRRRAVPPAGRTGGGSEVHAGRPDRRPAEQGRRRGRRTRRGAGARPGALLELANNAVTAEHFAQVDEAAADDIGLAWRVATTRAARGEYDEDAIERLLERDPDPDAPFSALTVRTARPLAEAKEEAWHAFYVEQSVPSGLSTYWMVMAFWQPHQREILLPFTWRYLEELPKLAGGLMLKVGALIHGMFPGVGDQAFLDAALAMAHAEGTDPTVR